MKQSILTGLCFGLTSAVITTLGLIVGLHSFSGSKLVIVGGVLTIAIADAFSDALGIHVSEEAENVHTSKEVWESTLTTFTAKFLFASTFIVPVLMFDLSTAIIVASVWGMLILTILSLAIAKINKKNPWNIVAEHVVIALIVVVLAHYVGDLISETFG